jgi:hypothetical protein
MSTDELTTASAGLGAGVGAGGGSAAVAAAVVSAGAAAAAGLEEGAASLPGLPPRLQAASQVVAATEMNQARRIDCMEALLAHAGKREVAEHAWPAD